MSSRGAATPDFVASNSQRDYPPAQPPSRGAGPNKVTTTLLVQRNSSSLSLIMFIAKNVAAQNNQFEADTVAVLRPFTIGTARSEQLNCCIWEHPCPSRNPPEYIHVAELPPHQELLTFSA